MPERTLLRWEPVLQREQPRGELDITWKWKVVVGRARDCDVTLKHPSIPPQHGQFSRLQNTWIVQNFNPKFPIYLRGKAISMEGVNDDSVDFAMLVRFRLDQLPIEDEERRFRDAIRAAPTDDANFRVYADWLLERGEELGQRMVSAPPYEPSWLGPLQSEGIAIGWRHGFFDTVKVRSSKSVFLRTGVFSDVLLHPLSAFLTSLEVDAVLLEQETGEISADTWVDRLFASLMASPPATLRQLKVRLPRELALRFEGEFKALKLKLPLLETTWDRLFTQGALT